jgi:hypothetical protein
MQTRSFFNRKKITRVARFFLELVYPLYGFASTPERRRYWRALPLRRAAPRSFLPPYFSCSPASLSLSMRYPRALTR